MGQTRVREARVATSAARPARDAAGRSATKAKKARKVRVGKGACVASKYIEGFYVNVAIPRSRLPGRGNPVRCDHRI
jgi:hypothetical protein